MKKLTIKSIEAGYEQKAYGNAGYLSGRKFFTRSQRSIADRMVLAIANAEGWTEADLFAWTNSKLGRWFADAVTDSGRKWNETASLITIREEA
jgi:hypothetical protein